MMEGTCTMTFMKGYDSFEIHDMTRQYKARYGKKMPMYDYDEV